MHIQSAEKSRGAALAKLPPELRLQLLSKLDHESLLALCDASRVYRAQFLADCESLLFKFFMNRLSGAALNAQMTFHSGTKAFLGARSQDTVD